MKKWSLLSVGALLATASAARAAPPKRDDQVSDRPTITYSPASPISAPSPSERNATCYVESHGDGETDDSEYILAALNSCNNGGHVVFSEGETYIIGTAMDWTFLQSIDIGEWAVSTLGGACDRSLTNMVPDQRYPGRDPLHQRHRLLAGELLQLCLPERHVVLQARWR